MIKHIFDTPETVAENFAKHFEEQSKNRQEFHLALSGGSTPKLLFDILARNFKDKINWSTIHFWWGDERCVPPTDDDSNYKMTKERLLDHLDINDYQIHRVIGENDQNLEATRYAKEIKEMIPIIDGLPKFDLIILGMGADGHTASIFPNEMKLLDAPRICEVARHPETGQNRITLTGNTINNAKEIVFLVTGASKQEKLEQIFGRTNGYEKYPAAHIKPVDGELSWYLDKAAMGE